MSKGYIENSIMLSKSLTKVFVVGALFYCTTEAASLIKGVIFCWDIRGNYSTKSTVAECVKQLCLGAFSSLPGVSGVEKEAG